MSTDSPTLLPCPFCGGAPRVSSTSGSDERNGYNFISSVRCGGCGATVAVGSREGAGGWCNEERTDTEARAATAWNRRVVGAVPADVEGLLRRVDSALAVYAEGRACRAGDHGPAPYEWLDRMRASNSALMRVELDNEVLLSDLASALRGRVVGGKDVAGLRERLDAASAKTVPLTGGKKP